MSEHAVTVLVFSERSKLYKYIAETLGTADFIGDFESGTPEWHQLRLQGVGGSEIGTILGWNNWESAYTLWHKKKGLIEDADLSDNVAVFIGNAMEQPILKRFAEKHPELEIWTTGTWRNQTHGWMHANPDAIYRNKNTDEWGIIEVKTGRNPWNGVPPTYRAQILWYMGVFGFKQGYLIGTPGYEWKEIPMEYDDFEMQAYILAGKRFMDYLHNDVKPDWDGSESTLTTVRTLNPLIEDSEVEVGEIGVNLYHAQKKADEAQAELNSYKSAVLDYMGTAKHATTTVDGEGTFRVASRQARKDGLPYLVVKK